MAFYAFYNSDGEVKYTDRFNNKEKLQSFLTLNPGLSALETEPFHRTNYIKVDLTGDTPQIIDETPEETDEDRMCELRIIRNNALRSSDWTQMPDAPFTDAKKAEWATYRQELRDITNTYSNCEDVVWPTKPS